MALEKTDILGIINNSPRARAIRHIQEWITDGRLAAGSRLPSEMRLAAKLNVSRTTVRLALEDLGEAGNDPFAEPAPHRGRDDKSAKDLSVGCDRFDHGAACSA